MSKRDEQELETLIKNVFFRAKKKSITPRDVRLHSIIKRSLYETAFKDLMIFCNHLLITMLSMLTLLIKAFSFQSK